VKIIEQEEAYKGFFKIARTTLSHRTFAGEWTKPLCREVFVRGEAAGVILYDPDQDAVVMIEQFRIGALLAGYEPWLFETVAGMVDPGETPEEAARRECLEETNCEVLAMHPIIRYMQSPGGSSESHNLFCGIVDSTKVNGLHGNSEEGEDIKVCVIPFDEAWEMLQQGEIFDSASIICMQWLKLNKGRLTTNPAT
jgi:ADP-ribose pyrophosphatase